MADTTSATDKAEMQLAVANGSYALTMPQEEFIGLYCQPIEDDTWIRRESLVKMEDLVETEGGEAIKREILQEYAEERVRSGQTVPPDPILEGMLMQEQFLEEYQATERQEDGDKAHRYRQRLVSSYRRKYSKDDTVPYVAEQRQLEYVTVDVRPQDDARDNVAVEEEQTHEDAAAAEEYPTETPIPDAATAATESADESAVDEEPVPSPVKTGPAASSPKAADATTTVTEPENIDDGIAAGDVPADADEL